MTQHQSIGSCAAETSPLAFGFTPLSSPRHYSMLSSILSRMKEEESARRDGDPFLQSCTKVGENKYLFGSDGQTGMYLPSTAYYSRREALELLDANVDWFISSVPSKLPSELVGSYIFIVDTSTFDNKKDLTNDWLRPWSSVKPDSKQRVTPKWEKIPMNDGLHSIRTSKSRHPRFPWIRRQMVFLATMDGDAIGKVFYQYVLEPSDKDASNVDISIQYQEEPEFSMLSESAQVACEPASAVRQKTPRRTLPFPEVEKPCPLDETFNCLKGNYISIRENLTTLKRKFCDATEVEEMRRLSRKCEELAVLESETRTEIGNLFHRTEQKLRKILDEEPAQKTPRIKEENSWPQ